MGGKGSGGHSTGREGCSPPQERLLSIGQGGGNDGEETSEDRQGGGQRAEVSVIAFRWG